MHAKGCRGCDGDGDINWRLFAASEWERGCSDENQQVPGDALLQEDVRGESGSTGGKAAYHTVGVTRGLVDILIVGVQKGIDSGDDMPCF